MVLMRKVAQNTKFDEIFQNKDPYRNNYYNLPKQRLLFPQGYGDWNKEESIRQEEKPLEHVKIDYPEVPKEYIQGKPLSPEQRADIANKITVLKENMEKHPSSAYYYKEDADKLQTILDKDESELGNYQQEIYNAYEKIRALSQKFYVAYQEANELATMDVEIDITVPYVELFSQFADFIVGRLTKQIGYLFGQGMFKQRHERYFNPEINIFNINYANYKETKERLKHIYRRMYIILEDYEKRKKILKYLKPKVEEQVAKYLANPEWVNFLNWMDEYFPYHKQEIINAALGRIDTYSRTHKNDMDRIILENLISFKTFKSIYERAQNVSTKGFASSLQYSLTSDVEKTLRDEIENRLKSKSLKLAQFVNFIDSKESSLSPTEKCDQILNFMRRHLGIDIRALFTFAAKSAKKRDEYWFATNDDVKGKEKQDIEELVAKENLKFFEHFVQQMSMNLGTYVRKENDGTIKPQWFVSSSASSAAHEIVQKKLNKNLTLENWNQVLNLGPTDLDKIANQILLKHILASIEGFVSIYSGYGGGRDRKRLSFDGISQIVQASGGKFSIDSIALWCHEQCPFVPKELFTSAVKILLGEVDYITLNKLHELSGDLHKQTLQVACKVLQREKKLDSNNLVKILRVLTEMRDEILTIVRHFPYSFSSEENTNIILKGIRSSQTMQTDLENLKQFASFLHNEAGQLGDDIVKRIVANENFINFNKLGIVKKLFKSYVQVKANGGLEGILEKFGTLISDLSKRGYLSKTFKQNINLVVSFFESNEEINPKSPAFAKLFEASSQIESDLAVLQMGDALKDLLKDYKRKNRNLFAIDTALRDDLRFRVLKDKDPRILRIGIETNCCQRIGGAGEVAARDSFINPLASVVVLEWKNPEDGDWKLLSQSYFHYVPKDKGYILDNVETNAANVKVFTEQTGISLEEIYAVYASRIKEKMDVKYFLAGKDYSKINANKFKTDVRHKDPRHFDDRALTRYNSHHYSDYDEDNGIDLLAPIFDVKDVIPKLERIIGKEAAVQMKQFVNSLMSFGLTKFAQGTNQDIKRLQGVNANLFGPRSWEFINQFMNAVNESLFELGATQKLGNQTLNFQSVIRNPTASTRFTGSLKNLFNISLSLWSIVTADRNNVYSVIEAKELASKLLNELTLSDFPEPKGSEAKAKLITILNNWLAILQ